MRKILRWSVLFFLVLFSIGLHTIFRNNTPPTNYIGEKEKLDSIQAQKLLEDEILMMLINFRCSHPYVAMAQFKLESGHFTSKLFLENNNPMGMKYPTSRPTTAIGVKNGYAEYLSIKDAVIDYIFWANYNRKGLNKLTDKEYIYTILEHYAEDPNYKEKVLTQTKTLKNEKFNRISSRRN